MPSVNKTPNLGLNNWEETDKPKRTDFVEDNLLLDTALTNHFQDTDLHFSPEDREQWNQRIVFGSYLGTGDESKTLTFPFSPKACILFKAGDTPCGYSAEKGYMVVNSGFYTEQDTSAGIGFLNKAVVVHQTQGEPETGKPFLNVNARGKLYVYMVFR